MMKSQGGTLLSIRTSLKGSVVLLQTAELIVNCALHRKESRGLHYTLDYPETLDEAVDTILIP